MEDPVYAPCWEFEFKGLKVCAWGSVSRSTPDVETMLYRRGDMNSYLLDNHATLRKLGPGDAALALQRTFGLSRVRVYDASLGVGVDLLGNDETDAA